MMRSMFSGVSGIKSHQTKMDVIGNNIANVNTTGFKSSRTTFADMISQNLSAAAAPTGTRGGVNAKQIGLGVGVGAIDLLFTDGSVQSTGKNTDLALSGNGLFVVKQGTETYYTRNGAFEFDADGNYVMPGNGMLVQGWTAENGQLNTTSAPDNIRIAAGSSMDAAMTEKITFANNLDYSLPLIATATDSTGAAVAAGTLIYPTSTTPYTLTMSDGTSQIVTSGSYTVGHSMPVTTLTTFYDSLGGSHSLVLLFEKAATGTVTSAGATPVTKDATAWVARLNTDSTGAATITEDDGTVITTTLTPANGITMVFDENGTYYNDPAATYTITDPAGKVTFPPTAGSATLTYTIGGNPAGVVSGGTTTATANFDMAGLTQYTGSNTISGSADGHSAGTLKSVAIDSSGLITGVYTNGVRRTEGQVAIAQFANASGLEKVGNSLYQESNNSGVANVKTATDLGVSITASAIEMSNVDIANEFSEMIITQRGFQSNSKIVTVSDEMLETVINMKR